VKTSGGSFPLVNSARGVRLMSAIPSDCGSGIFEYLAYLKEHTESEVATYFFSLRIKKEKEKPLCLKIILKAISFSFAVSGNRK
jgi:hypothetical protein